MKMLSNASPRKHQLVSVVVVNHDRAELLRECLASLLRQSYHPLEILVVDNGSADHSDTVVASFPKARVRLKSLGRNLGFAAGSNIGIRESKGEMVALLNNDAVAGPCWIEELVEAMQSSSQVGMCASKVLFSRSNVIDKVGHLMYPDGQNRGRGTGEEDRGQYDRQEEVLFPDGCAALYRRQLLNDVGGFDDSFFAYGDDADLGIRARWMGWKCLYVPEAVVHHHHSATSGPYSREKIYWVERNRFWLAVKNFPLPLLLLSPILTVNRWAWNLLAAAVGRGSAGNFRRETSLVALLTEVVRSQRDGFRLLGQMLEKRRHVMAGRRISNLEFYRLLRRFRISALKLSFEDVDYSFRKRHDSSDQETSSGNIGRATCS